MHLKQSDFGITTNDLKVPVNIVNLEIKVFSHQSRDAATASLKSSRVLNYRFFLKGIMCHSLLGRDTRVSDPE